MNKSRKRTGWAGAGLSLTLLAGSSAFADDVELLLSNPNSSGAEKPNVMFILDTSGSMSTIETTQEPFDKTQLYAGDCNQNRVYWTEGSSAPDCDTSNWVSNTNFVCATGTAALLDTGMFTDTMAQYRPANGTWKWRRPRSGRDEILECESDSGLHGDGDPADVYARIGSNQPPFTNNAGAEVDWGSSPTERIVTAYSGNYLNWLHNSPVTSMSRIDIVKTVTKNVLDSIQNANIGLMRFNWDQGGSVTHAVKDLGTNRTAAKSKIDAMTAAGWTPLSETMYEAALYWRGMTPRYGTGITDTDAFTGDAVSGYQYNQPANFACAKNFNVLLTDGEPTQDLDAYGRVTSLPGWSGGSCDGGYVDGSCLDDIAEYLHTVDINDAVPGDQTVSTYTIGFTIDLDLLQETASKSGGKYYLASDTKSLTTALTEIVTNIFDRDISFTSPSVSVNAFNRTQNLNDMYISVFRARNRTHWNGNLKKYRIVDGQIKDKLGNDAVDAGTGFFSESSHSYWTDGTVADGANVSMGGAASQMPDPAVRRLYTNINGNALTDPSNAISPSNAASFSQADFGLSGAPNEPSVHQMIQWARGVDVRNEDGDPDTLVRNAMGDTLHSQPASIVYGTVAGNPDVVVYTATNDGYLHAIDAESGEELWSFIPSGLLADLGELYFDAPINYKHYALDGDIVPIIADRNNNGTIEPGTDFVYLIFGMRRGGNHYYALDVTDKNSPRVKWINTYENMGQSWSPPVVAKVDVTGVNADKAVLIIGGGYDTVHDQPAMPTAPDGEGAGIHMIDLHSGTELWRAALAGTAEFTHPMMTRAFPSRIRVLDMSGDGLADRMYAVDIGGQLWRFDIFNGNAPASLVEGGVLARLGAEGIVAPTAADTRRFFAAPDVAMFTDENLDTRYLAISVGSGYRAHPLNNDADDRFYSYRDPMVFAQMDELQYGAHVIAYDADFVNVQGTFGVELTTGDRGWKYTLPPGEKIFAESQTFDDAVYFVSFEPQVSSADPCQAGLAVNRLYKVSIVNGDPVTNLDTLDPDNPVEIDAERVTELEQGGIAPKPTFLFPSPDDPDCEGDACSPPPLGCVGVECFDPGYVNSPVRTLWTQDGVD
ncbi:MAG: PilC/PilY family type IV pilus protein [Woeseia sp.]